MKACDDRAMKHRQKANMRMLLTMEMNDSLLRRARAVLNSTDRYLSEPL